MTLAPLLAAGAACAGVAACWELVAAIERTAVAAYVERLAAPLRAASADGRAPSAVELRRLIVVAAVAALAAGWLLGGAAIAALAGAGGPAVALTMLRLRRARWRRALDAQAPAVARALADALTGGASVRGALGSAAAGGIEGVAGGELRRAAARLALGEPTDVVLERLRARARSPAWDTLVAAILLQRDAGGDLAGLLRDLAGSLEHTRRLEADARGVTAQSRASAGIVLALPAGAAVLAELAAPGFFATLVSTPASAALTAAAALLQLVALVLIRRLSRVGPS